jgi:hypothetical protein
MLLKWDHRKGAIWTACIFLDWFLLGYGSYNIQTVACHIGVCGTIVIVLFNVYEGASRLVLPFDRKRMLMLVRGLTVIFMGLTLLTVSHVVVFATAMLPESHCSCLLVGYWSSSFLIG